MIMLVYGGYTCEKYLEMHGVGVRPQLRKDASILVNEIVLKGKDGNKTIRYESSKKEIQKEIESSLRNLGTDYIDLLLVHRTQDILADPQETADALDQLVQEREEEFIHLGVSNFMPSQIAALQSYMKQN